MSDPPLLRRIRRGGSGPASGLVFRALAFFVAVFVTVQLFVVWDFQSDLRHHKIFGRTDEGGENEGEKTRAIDPTRRLPPRELRGPGGIRDAPASPTARDATGGGAKVEPANDFEYVPNCRTDERTRRGSHGSGRTRAFAVEDGPSKSNNREGDSERAESFSKIYSDNVWGGGETINGKHFGGSGPGSLVSSTAQVRATLDAAIDRVKAALGKDRVRMLDLPCGDLVWMKHYLTSRTDVDYTGMDIVGSLTEEHARAFSDEHPWEFAQHDIVKDPLPATYDLIFSRQMTQHLTTDDTLRVLKHFSDGGRYLLITNYLGVAQNTRLDPTRKFRFRQQNLNVPPYSLVNPICDDIEEGCVNDLYELPLRQWL